MGHLKPVKKFIHKNADEVYKEARALISAIGPSHFILSSGCSIPAIAPPENIEAMVRAANEG
jgi:uroporphyrinogen-III decarboxylase